MQFGVGQDWEKRMMKCGKCFLKRENKEKKENQSSEPFTERPRYMIAYRSYRAGLLLGKKTSKQE